MELNKLLSLSGLQQFLSQNLDLAIAIHEWSKFDAYYAKHPDDQVVMAVFENEESLTGLIEGICENEPIPLPESWTVFKGLISVSNDDYIASIKKNVKPKTVEALEDKTQYAQVRCIAVEMPNRQLPKGNLLDNYFILTSTAIVPPRCKYSDLATYMLNMILRGQRILDAPDSGKRISKLGEGVEWRTLNASWSDKTTFNAAFRSFRITGEFPPELSPEPFGDFEDTEPKSNADAYRVRLCVKSERNTALLTPFFSCEIGIKYREVDLTPEDMLGRFIPILNKQQEAMDLIDRTGIILCVHYVKQESFERHVEIGGMDPVGHPDRPTFKLSEKTFDDNHRIAIEIHINDKLLIGTFVNIKPK